MENFANKIQILNYSDKEKMSLNKFMTSLSDDIVSYEELEKIYNYLKANGINITKPSQNKIFACSYDFIFEVVEEYKSMSLVNALIEDPTRITCKNSIKRIKYFQLKGLPLTKPNGKFVKDIFSKTLFEKTYGNIDLDSELKPKEFDPLASNEYKQEDKTITNLFSENKNLDEYEAVINAPQVPADDDAIKSFDKLYSYAEKVLNKLYGTDNSKVSVPDNVCTNLIKLTAQKMDDEKKILLYALTYGKHLGEEEEQFIKNKIDEIFDNDSEFGQIELESI